MATYLQGVTDYIPQIQPFRPDYNFLGNVLETRQTKYDSSKKQISELYGSLLNGPLSKETNIKRRDEFFKVIDNDIKRISGLDLSLQQNVDQAQNVFKGFYDDKYLVSDMVKTKNHMNELEKGENSKYCYDQDKCGGTYNELSMKKLQYKMEEFKATSDDEGLNFDMGSYDAYYNWQKDAAKNLKDQGMTVTQDSESGHYIVRDKNGKLVENALYNMFDQIYSSDPRVAANYDTKAYVFRKDSVRGLMPQYNNDEKAAEKAFIEQNMNNGIKALNKDLTIVNNNHNQLKGRQVELERKQGALTNREKQELELIKQRREEAGLTRDNIQSKLNSIQTSMDTGDMRSLINKFDQSNSAAFQHEDLNKMAKIMSMQGAEHTIVKETAAYEHALAKDLAKYNSDLNIFEKVIQNNLDKDKELYKNQVEKGTVTTPGAPAANATTEIFPGAVGSNVALNLVDHPEGVYMLQAVESSNVFEKANSGSVDLLYKTFGAAKKAAKDPITGAGAIDYLDKTYGKGKWQNMDTAEQVKSFVKNAPMVYLKKTENYIKDNPNTSWGKEVLKSNSIALAQVDIDRNAGLAQLENFKKGIKTTAEKVANSADPDLALAKHLLNKNGILDYDDKPNAAFITAYRKTRPSASMGAIEDAFAKVKGQFLYTYNRQPNVGFDQMIDISKNEGSGMKSSNSLLKNRVDSAENSDINKQISSTLSQAFANPGKYKALIGGLDAENYASSDESDPGADAFFRQFLMDMNNASSKDAKRPIYSVVVNGTAADDLTQSGFTIRPSQAYIQEYMTKNEKNPGLVSPDILTKGVSLFYDNTAIKTDITKALKVNPVEKILLQKGSYTVNNFLETSGRIEVDYDADTKLTTIQPYYISHDGDKILNLKGTPYVVDDIKSVDESLNMYINLLAQGQQNNDLVDEKQRLINQSKNK
jgi:hypothetical protein